MHIQTDVAIENGEWKIRHTYDEGVVMRDCYNRRMSGEEGWVHGKKAKLICRIPRHRLATDFELQMYQKYQGKDTAEAQKWLNIWMHKNPEFRTTNARYTEKGKLVKND